MDNTRDRTYVPPQQTNDGYTFITDYKTNDTFAIEKRANDETNSASDEINNALTMRQATRVTLQKGGSLLARDSLALAAKTNDVLLMK